MNYDEEVPHTRAMSLRQIEVFRAIMMTGSISEAARSLYVAQPSVSRVLQVTESRLGFLLFERMRGRLYPTPEAKRIFEEVLRAYEGIERVESLVRSLADGSSGMDAAAATWRLSSGGPIADEAVERHCGRAA